MSSEISFTIITILLGIIGYFLKRTFDLTGKMEDKIDAIATDVSEMKPKVDILFSERYIKISSQRT